MELDASSAQIIFTAIIHIFRLQHQPVADEGIYIKKKKHQIACVKGHFSFSSVCLLLIPQRFVRREDCWGGTGVFLSCRSFEWGYFEFCNFHPILWTITAVIWCPESLCFIFTLHDLNWSFFNQVWVEAARRTNMRSPKKGERSF